MWKVPCRLLSCSDFLCISEHFARLSLAKPLQNEGPSVSERFFLLCFGYLCFIFNLGFFSLWTCTDYLAINSTSSRRGGKNKNLKEKKPNLSSSCCFYFKKYSFCSEVSPCSSGVWEGNHNSIPNPKFLDLLKTFPYKKKVFIHKKFATKLPLES